MSREELLDAMEQAFNESTEEYWRWSKKYKQIEEGLQSGALASTRGKVREAIEAKEV